MSRGGYLRVPKWVLAEEELEQAERERCQLGDRCPFGAEKCESRRHYRSKFPVYDSDVEMLIGGEWKSVSTHPGSRYAPSLTWKALREQGAFA